MFAETSRIERGEKLKRAVGVRHLSLKFTAQRVTDGTTERVTFPYITPSDSSIAHVRIHEIQIAVSKLQNVKR